MIAENNPDDYGYPWPDNASGQLVVSVVNDRAAGGVRQWQQQGLTVTHGLKAAHAAQPTVPLRVRVVKYSYAQLERIKDDAASLVDAGVPDATSIWRTGPDWENNRVIITVDRQSGALLGALAQRFDPETIAVRVDPNRANIHLLSGTRASDGPPFYGGARINTPLGSQWCTGGWPWVAAQYELMTAGHCVPNGGSISTNAAFVGNLTQTTFENWNPGTGTVMFPGDSMFRGDLALSTASSGSVGQVYSQGLNSTVFRYVAEMWFGAPHVGDQFCTDGSYSFEICGFAIPSLSDIRNDWPVQGQTLRNVTRGEKTSGPCLQGGDSGGPVYTIRFDSRVAAKGVLNAADQGTPCRAYFTDMDLAYWYFPGVLVTGP